MRDPGPTCSSAAARWLEAWFTFLAAFGVLASGCLCAGLVVPDWLLPATLALAGLLAWRRPGTAATGGDAPAVWHRGQRWLVAVCAVAILAAAGLVAYGALATPSRDWDGVVAWDLKTAALAAAPHLDQPLFAAPEVYSHSRDYPLLQPLVIAMTERLGVPGRLLFPLAYLALSLSVLAAARGVGASSSKAWLCALACGFTPMLLTPGGGSFDSGYGDGLLAAAVAGVACGLTSQRPWLVAGALVTAVLQKPEGLPYAAALALACLVVAPGWQLRVVAASLAVGALAGLPLQHVLATGGRAGAFSSAGMVVFCAAVAMALGARVGRHSAGLRLALALAAGAVAACLLFTVARPAGILGAHFDPARLVQRIDRLPVVGASIAEWAWMRGRFGLTFVLPMLVAVGLCWQRQRPRAAELAGWLVLAVPLWCIPFLLSPIDDLSHHIRSTMPRVMLHWVGAVWCWLAVQPFDCARPRARDDRGPPAGLA